MKLFASALTSAATGDYFKRQHYPGPVSLPALVSWGNVFRHNATPLT